MLIWGGFSIIESVLLVVQKTAVRVICRPNEAFKFHCRPLFIQLQILNAVNLNICSAFVYVYFGKERKPFSKH